MKECLKLYLFHCTKLVVKGGPGRKHVCIDSVYVIHMDYRIFTTGNIPDCVHTKYLSWALHVLL